MSHNCLLTWSIITWASAVRSVRHWAQFLPSSPSCHIHTLYLTLLIPTTTAYRTLKYTMSLWTEIYCEFMNWNILCVYELKYTMSLWTVIYREFMNWNILCVYELKYTMSLWTVIYCMFMNLNIQWVYELIYTMSLWTDIYQYIPCKLYSNCCEFSIHKHLRGFSGPTN